jgi:hypothetical protein
VAPGAGDGEAKYRRGERPGKLTAFHERLVQALKADSHRPKRDRRTARALYAVHQLAELAFTEQAHNAVLVGGPGTGKTHLGTAIGVSGITRHGRRVRFYSTVDLVNAPEHEMALGKAGRIATSLLRMIEARVSISRVRIQSAWTAYVHQNVHQPQQKKALEHSANAATSRAYLYNSV